MWHFFRSNPPCPVDEERRHWVDGRFDWLLDELGEDVPRKAVAVLPTPEFFPDPYSNRPEDVLPLLQRVAGFMNVDPQRFKLFFYNEGESPLRSASGLRAGSAGVYMHGTADDTRATIGIEQRQLENPMALVATLAHEIGHEILLGQGRVTADEEDHEPLTDLLTVFMGMGIFGGNATIHDRGWSSGTWSGWTTGRSGYLDQRTFGYALAKFAWARNERKPRWMKHVRLDVRHAMKSGLRFLSHQK